MRWNPSIKGLFLVVFYQADHAIMAVMAKLVLLNKPYGVVSQFTPVDGHPGLATLISEKGVYPAGRLDHDSEGLLLLTDNGGLQARITQPKFKLAKTYWVQVEGLLTASQLAMLEAGVLLNDGATLPARARAIAPPTVWNRSPPIRFRKSVPTSWLELIISEGRNRQVRRMTAAVGIPTLRLIRIQIGDWSLGDLQPGESRVVKVHSPGQNSQPRRPGTAARNRVRRRPEE